MISSRRFLHKKMLSILLEKKGFQNKQKTTPEQNKPNKFKS